ncbi:MAG: hypothetical protein LBK99_22885, partial [Opitutaceae bacterium]|nr:hypothetical protein [Opitutaceae bacterium]
MPGSPPPPPLGPIQSARPGWLDASGLPGSVSWLDLAATPGITTRTLRTRARLERRHSCRCDEARSASPLATPPISPATFHCRGGAAAGKPPPPRAVTLPFMGPAP